MSDTLSFLDDFGEVGVPLSAHLTNIPGTAWTGASGISLTASGYAQGNAVSSTSGWLDYSIAPLDGAAIGVFAEVGFLIGNPPVNSGQSNTYEFNFMNGATPAFMITLVLTTATLTACGVAIPWTYAFTGANSRLRVEVAPNGTFRVLRDGVEIGSGSGVPVGPTADDIDTMQVRFGAANETITAGQKRLSTTWLCAGVMSTMSDDEIELLREECTGAANSTLTQPVVGLSRNGWKTTGIPGRRNGSGGWAAQNLGGGGTVDVSNYIDMNSVTSSGYDISRGVYLDVDLIVGAVPAKGTSTYSMTLSTYPATTRMAGVVQLSTAGIKSSSENQYITGDPDDILVPLAYPAEGPLNLRMELNPTDMTWVVKLNGAVIIDALLKYALAPLNIDVFTISMNHLGEDATSTKNNLIVDRIRMGILAAPEPPVPADVLDEFDDAAGSIIGHVPTTGVGAWASDGATSNQPLLTGDGTIMSSGSSSWSCELNSSPIDLAQQSALEVKYNITGPSSPYGISRTDATLSMGGTGTGLSSDFGFVMYRSRVVGESYINVWNPANSRSYHFEPVVGPLAVLVVVNTELSQQSLYVNDLLVATIGYLPDPGDAGIMSPSLSLAAFGESGDDGAHYLVLESVRYGFIDELPVQPEGPFWTQLVGSRQVP